MLELFSCAHACIQISKQVKVISDYSAINISECTTRLCSFASHSGSYNTDAAHTDYVMIGELYYTCVIIVSNSAFLVKFCLSNMVFLSIQCAEGFELKCFNMIVATNTQDYVYTV